MAQSSSNAETPARQSGLQQRCEVKQTLSFHSLENFNHSTRQFTKRIDHGGAGLAQRLHFAGVRATTTFNNRARVTEACAFTRRLAADVCDHRLAYFSIANQLREFLFL